MRIRIEAAVIISMIIVPLQILPCLAADSILARVNGEKITLSDYKKFVLKNDPVMNPEIPDQKLLKRMLEEKLILQEAVKLGLQVTEEEADKAIQDFLDWNKISISDLQKKIEQEGLNMAEYRRLFMEGMQAARLISREVDSKTTPADGEVEAYYNENKALYIREPERMEVKAIFLGLSEAMSLEEVTELKLKALKIYAGIQAGTFEKMSELYGEESMKKTDGLLGTFRKGELVGTLDSVLAALKPGEISSPVWVKEGCYILKLQRRLAETYIPLDAVKDSLHEIVYKQKRHRLYNEWIKTLWERSSIIIEKQP